MLSTLGPVAISAGVGSSCVAFGLWVAVARGRRAAQPLAGMMMVLSLLAALAAVVVMEIALVTNDFSVRYVAENSGTAVPLYYRITGLWAALEGSLLLWLVVLAGYGLALARKAPKVADLHAWMMATFSTVMVFFFGLALATSSAFGKVSPVPDDGPGPNPLLQDHPLMAVHPPLLYLGYVGLTIPFAYAVAALITGRTGRQWLVPLRRWTLFAWTCLTIGILMGMWWSYAVLGWGGYWAWDPVENASILPWFTATALIHSVMVQERRQILGVWNITLAASTFVMVLIGTFLTRSGVVASVHAFTQSNIGPVFLVYIAVVVLAVVGLLIWRSDRLGNTGRIEAVRSREAVLLVNNVLFVTLGITVLVGTTFPLIREAAGGGPSSVGAPFFNDIVVPVALVIVLLMGIGPLVPWGGAEVEHLLDVLRAPTLVGLAVVAATTFLVGGGVRAGLGYGAIAFAAAALGALLARDVRTARRADESRRRAVVRVLRARRRRYGGMLVHGGILLAILAITASSTLEQSREATLDVGDSVSVGDYTATLTDITRERTDRFMVVGARTTLTKGGDGLGEYTPQLRFYPTMNEAIGRPAVHSDLVSDAYVTVASVDPETGQASVRIAVTPMVMWLWLSGGVVAGGVLLAAWPSRGERGGRRRERRSSGAGSVAAAVGGADG